MKGFLLTHKGAEDIAALEVKEILDQKAKGYEEYITFPIKSEKDLCTLCYRSQSARKISLILTEFDYKNLESDLKKQKIPLEKWIKDKSCRVSVIKTIETSSVDLEKSLSSILFNKLKPKVNLDNPDIIISIYINKTTCIVGIDFAGFDLSKRTYNIFQHPSQVKGTIAYILTRLSGFKKTKNLLDCFATSGLIPLEAALYASNTSIHLYNKDKFQFLKLLDYKFQDKKPSKTKVFCTDEQMKHLAFAKKNAKIAGTKEISFSRIDIEFLDTKFKKNQINHIATKLPTINQDKLYNEFFYQAEYILKDKMAVIADPKLTKKYTKQHKLKILEHREIFSGKEKYNVFIITK